MHSVELFKGNRILKLQRDEDDKYPFSFGYAKAKLILEHIDAIKAFVSEGSTKPKPPKFDERYEDGIPF